MPPEPGVAFNLDGIGQRKRGCSLVAGLVVSFIEAVMRQAPISRLVLQRTHFPDAEAGADIRT